jgi:hypothetical protein
MKKTMKLMLTFSIIGALFFISACGGGGGEKVELSEKGKLLTSISWKLDPNATLKGTTDLVEDTTGITADIELKGDVKAFADFVAETVVFAIDSKDPSKLSYSRTIGEGFLSSSVSGYWEFNADETAVIMKEWDDQAGKEKEPVTYNIVELTADKLVLQKEGDASPNIYFPKK